MYDALDVAKYVINYCNKIKKEPISNLQLQKILYFLWIDYFKQTQKRLFDDYIFAWKFGPVVQTVYDEFCTYGGLPIAPVYEYEYKAKKNISNAGDREDINNIIDKYRKLDVFELVEKTHKAGKPWSVVFNEKGNRAVIPFDLIEKLECQSC